MSGSLMIRPGQAAAIESAHAVVAGIARPRSGGGDPHDRASLDCFAPFQALAMAGQALAVTGQELAMRGRAWLTSLRN
jgi:hypothetical protein